MADPVSSPHPSTYPTPQALPPPSKLSSATPTSIAEPPAGEQPPPPAAPRQDAHPPAGRQPAPDAAGAAELARLQVSLQAHVRRYPDFPAPGILFEDIFPLFRSPQVHADLLRALELFVGPARGGPGAPDVVVGLDARGFLFGPSLALRLGAGFAPVRKPGKLPGATERVSYVKEYGADHFEIQRDAVRPGQTVLVVDDLMATGGSAAAAGALVEKLGGKMLGYLFLIELAFLKGRDKLNAPVYTLFTSQQNGGAGSA